MIPNNAKPYDLVCTGTVQAGVQRQTIEARVDDADFVALSREVCVRYSGTADGAVAFTRFAERPSATASANTTAPLSGVEFQAQIGDDFLSNAAIPAGAFGGNDTKDGFLPVEFVLPARQTIRHYVNNNTAVPAIVTVVYRGYKRRS